MQGTTKWLRAAVFAPLLISGCTYNLAKYPSPVEFYGHAPMPIAWWLETIGPPVGCYDFGSHKVCEWANHALPVTAAISESLADLNEKERTPTFAVDFDRRGISVGTAITSRQ